MRNGRLTTIGGKIETWRRHFGKSITPEIFYNIWRIAECGPVHSLEIRGVEAFTQKSKGFRKTQPGNNKTRKLPFQDLTQTS